MSQSTVIEQLEKMQLNSMRSRLISELGHTMNVASSGTLTEPTLNEVIEAVNNLTAEGVSHYEYIMDRIGRREFSSADLELDEPVLADPEGKDSVTYLDSIMGTLDIMYAKHADNIPNLSDENIITETSSVEDEVEKAYRESIERRKEDLFEEIQSIVTRQGVDLRDKDGSYNSLFDSVKAEIDGLTEKQLVSYEESAAMAGLGVDKVTGIDKAKTPNFFAAVDAVAKDLQAKEEAYQKRLAKEEAGLSEDNGPDSDSGNDNGISPEDFGDYLTENMPEDYSIVPEGYHNTSPEPVEEEEQNTGVDKGIQTLSIEEELRLLREELARLKVENERLREEVESLKASEDIIDVRAEDDVRAIESETVDADESQDVIDPEMTHASMEDLVIPPTLNTADEDYKPEPASPVMAAISMLPIAAVTAAGVALINNPDIAVQTAEYGANAGHVINGIPSMLGDAIDKASTVSSDAFQSLVYSASDAADNIGMIYDDISSSVFNYAEGALEGAKSALSNAISSAKLGFADIYASVSEFGKNVWESGNEFIQENSQSISVAGVSAIVGAFVGSQMQKMKGEIEEKRAAAEPVLSHPRM